MSFKLAELQIEANMPISNIRDSVEKGYLAGDRAKWLEAKQAEYDVLFPTYRDMTEAELRKIHDDGLSDGSIWQERYFLWEEGLKEIPQVVIDYSENEDYLPLNEWLNSTNTVLDGTVTKTDDEGTEYEEEVFKEVPNHIYVTNDVTSLVDEYMFPIELKRVSDIIQKILDDSAISRGYDSIISECSYATSSGSFGAEAQITVDWRDSVWTYIFIEQEKVLNGGVKPTIEELIAGLPVRG